VENYEMTVDQLERDRLALEKGLKAFAEGPVLRTSLLESAAAYLTARVTWSIAELTDRMDRDIVRTRAHDAFLGNLNIATRAIARTSESLEWRKRYMDYGPTEERKALGDFACYLAFQQSLSAR
jgi:hypothetical protein